jgi:predicted transposase YbfD/YdcC
MDVQATAGILRAFADMPDPRRHNRRHKLMDILTIALIAVICGADGWVGVVEYAKAKLEWLKSFLELPYGLPSHDTFGRVFAKLDPDAFERCFQAWMAALVELSGGKLVAFDGKSIRHSFEHAWDKSGMAHIVSAFVQANHMVFAQHKTDGKGQELSAIEKLLEILELNGAVVTIDAIGCNKEIAQKIVDAGADYILQVKDNQPTLHQTLAARLNDAILDNFAGLSSDYYEQTDGDHGRIEMRKLWVCWDEQLLRELPAEWPGLRAIIVRENTREANGKSSTQRHYYISSLDRRTKARRLAEYTRGHWGVENNLHWQLDVSFREDQRRIRKDHGAENFSRLCRIGLNLLKKDTTRKCGIAIKRQICGWDNDYLLKIVAG